MFEVTFILIGLTGMLKVASIYYHNFSNERALLPFGTFSGKGDPKCNLNVHMLKCLSDMCYKL